MSENNGNGKIRFRPDDITLGDMEDMEEITGQTFDELLPKLQALGSDPENPMKGISAKLLKAIVLVAKRQQDPEFSMADLRKTKLLSLVDELEVDLREPDPTSPAG